MRRYFALALAVLATLSLALEPAAAAARRPIVVDAARLKEIPAADTLQTPTPSTANASVNLPHGTAPTSPTDGDCWTTTAGLFCRINGATVGPYAIAGGGGAGSLTLISEVVTSGSQASVTFSSISGSYRDLIVRVRGRSGLAAATNQVVVRYNGDTGSNYDGEQFQVFGTNTATDLTLQSLAATQASMGYLPGANATAGVGGGAELIVYDYRGTTFQKSADYHSGVKFGTSTGQLVDVRGFHAWRSTAAITSIVVFLETAGTFVNGSVVSLYGSL